MKIVRFHLKIPDGMSWTARRVFTGREVADLLQQAVLKLRLGNFQGVTRRAADDLRTRDERD